MGQELTQRIKEIFPDHARVIESAESIEDPRDGHSIVFVKLSGTREQLDAFHRTWDVTDTGMHIMTNETVSLPHFSS
ncbi:hypothetical protein SAMN04489740_4275 [Arthrobacter alpinus]|uniref:Uncharacterized protein n=1 Tax=Arthrobacter alpinus TaxID=656366 RepID=A0A1H5PI24_9MICC|nr:hypothetical protein [Arthrobacter alpinus]SEF12691.1 hypothetical protein SAMN04489740_4275 [Arthrobacter alpinus]